MAKIASFDIAHDAKGQVYVEYDVKESENVPRERLISSILNRFSSPIKSINDTCAMISDLKVYPTKAEINRYLAKEIWYLTLDSKYADYDKRAVSSTIAIVNTALRDSWEVDI